MNSQDIQRLLDHPDSLGIVKLPAGEFEGPFVISRSCHVVGNGTTLWRRNGAVLEIRARGVTVENLRAEITGSSPDIAVSSKSDDVKMSGIYISGLSDGIENGPFILPKMISAGKIEPEKSFEILSDIYLSAPAEIVSEISGVSVSPKNLPAGKSVITVTVDPVSEGSVIYGTIEVKTKFIREIYLSLSSDTNFTAVSGQKIFTVNDEDISSVTPAAPTAEPQREILPAPKEAYGRPVNSPAQNTPPVQTRPSAADSGILIRGQRADIETILGSRISAELFFRSSDPSIEIDGYTFLLNKNGMAETDEHLVFFGNTESLGAVKYEDNPSHKTVSVNLASIPPDIENIAVTYSIYGDEPSRNFSKVRDARVIFKGENGKVLEFALDGLVMEKTVVAAQIYRKNGKWKINAVGQGYRGGLRKLCESFGLSIED